jgi:hypothetical protein
VSGRAIGPAKRPDDANIYMDLPRWGYAEAIERVAFSAVPLLAGFAVTFIGFVLTGDVVMRWPNATLLALTASVMLLLVALQLAFTARASYLPYPEFKERIELIRGLDLGERIEYVAALQRHRRLVAGVRVAYNLGIVALLAGLAAALVPVNPDLEIDPERKAAIAIAALAALGELLWALYAVLGDWRAWRLGRRSVTTAASGSPS